MTGCFITLEGGEGVGKSTNMAFIEQHLNSRSIPFIRSREPGGTPLGESIRNLLLNSESMDVQAELLMVFAARAQHIQTVIKPALVSGCWVVCDRFTDASYAYQGGGREIDSEAIKFLETWVQHGLQPDLTLLLDAPIDVGMDRIKVRSQMDRFELEKASFFHKVREAYLERAMQFPERIKVVDASVNLIEVQSSIAHHLDQLLASKHV